MIRALALALCLACAPVSLPPPKAPLAPTPPTPGPALVMEAGDRAPWEGILLSPQELAAGAEQIAGLRSLLPLEYERGRAEVSAALGIANRRLARWQRWAPLAGALGILGGVALGVAVSVR